MQERDNGASCSIDFNVGDAVEIVGFTANKIMNGMKGLIVELSCSGRCKVRLAGKCFSIKTRNLLKLDNLPEYKYNMIEENDKSSSTVVSVGTMTTTCEETTVDAESSESPSMEGVEGKSSEAEKHVRFSDEETHEDDQASGLFSGRRDGLFRSGKNPNGIFGKHSRMAALLAKMNTLGAIDTPALKARAPHLARNPDLTKIFGIAGGAPKDENKDGTKKDVKEVKEGMAAMMDISVDEILEKVENMRGSETPKDPKLVAMLAVVDMIKEVRTKQ